jgi:hypothetical protein
MVPTLEIIHPDLPGAKMIINEADYDPTVHQLYNEEPRSSESTTSADEPRKRKRRTAPTSPPAEELAPSSPPTEDLLPEGVSPETPDPQDLASTSLPAEDLIPEVVDPTSLSQEDPAFEQLPPEEPIPTYSQSDLEAKNLTALRAIAAENRIPRRMKLSRDELIEAILGGVGNGE